jgi:hypothetical protein
MRTLKKLTQSEVIGFDDVKHHIPIELFDVRNAPISIKTHINKLTKSIKKLPGSRTSGLRILRAIASARRLNEKPKHGGTQYANSH